MLQDYTQLPFFSIIVFSDRSTLKINDVTLPDTYVIKRDQLYKMIKSVNKKHKEILSVEQKDNKYFNEMETVSCHLKNY